MNNETQKTEEKKPNYLAWGLAVVLVLAAIIVYFVWPKSETTTVASKETNTQKNTQQNSSTNPEQKVQTDAEYQAGTSAAETEADSKISDNDLVTYNSETRILRVHRKVMKSITTYKPGMTIVYLCGEGAPNASLVQALLGNQWGNGLLNNAGNYTFKQVDNEWFELQLPGPPSQPLMGNVAQIDNMGTADQFIRYGNLHTFRNATWLWNNHAQANGRVAIWFQGMAPEYKNGRPMAMKM